MVSKKVVTVVFIIAILLFAFSIIMMVSNYGSDANAVPTPENNVESDTDYGQVSIIINKPSTAP